MLKLTVIGNLGSDPEEKILDGGRLLVKFRLAAQHRTSKENVTTWINVAVFGKLAELAKQFLRKGSKVYVEGLPAARGYKNRQDEVMASIDLTADQIEFLDRRGEVQDAGNVPTPVDNSDIPF